MLQTELLNLWIDICALVNNDRIVQNLPYNEAHVCNLLLRAAQEDPAHPYRTPTQLCRMTGMAKSLMNRTLNSLEKKQLIVRITDAHDRRITPICLNPEKMDVFLEVHNRSLSVVQQLTQYWGPQQSEQIVQALRLIYQGARDVLGGNESTHGRTHCD